MQSCRMILIHMYFAHQADANFFNTYNASNASRGLIASGLITVVHNTAARANGHCQL